MTAVKRVLMVIAISILALLQLAGGNATAAYCVDGANFSSYGFGYVKVTNLKTKESVFLVDTKTHEHCCGDMAQYTQYINHISAAARKYIEDQDMPLDAFNLEPTFSKCMKSEVEAEGIRSKKITYFAKLGYKALEFEMEIPDSGCK